MRTSKPLILTALLMGVSLSPASQAGSPPTVFQDTAWVVSSNPVYENVNEPRRDCWTEQSGYEAPRERGYGGAILGGITGAILGAQVGRGGGRDVAIGVGAATGAIVGDNIDNDGRRPAGPRIEQRCRTVDNWSKRLSGYDVAYRYHGQTFTAFMPYDPGRTVKVDVSVRLSDR